MLEKEKKTIFKKKLLEEEHLLPELPEEPYTDLLEAATVTTLFPFFSASSTLRFH